MMIEVMIMMMMTMMMILMIKTGWRPLRGNEHAQRDTALKLIAIHLAEIENWGRC